MQNKQDSRAGARATRVTATGGLFGALLGGLGLFWVAGGAGPARASDAVAPEEAPRAASASTGTGEAPVPAPAGGILPAAPLLDARMADLDDKTVTLRSMRGQVVVLLHQDKASSDQNAAFKERVGELAGKLSGRVQLVALAEVGAYNFWPARRYVKSALKPLRDQGGALVLCDWSSAVRKSYRLAAGQSAVFVLDAQGELRGLQRGVLSDAEQAQTLALIERLARP